MIRDRICRALEKYIDGYRSQIQTRIDPKIKSTTEVLADKLPGAIMDFMTNRFAEDHSAMEGILDFVATVTDRMPAKFKDKIHESIREVVYEAMDGISDKVTDAVLNSSKNAIREATGQSVTLIEKEKIIVKEKKEKPDKSFRELIDIRFDLSWLFKGKEGIVGKILELLRAPINHVGSEIQDHLVTTIPKRVEEHLAEVLPDADNDGQLDGFRGAVLGVFGQRDTKNNVFAKMIMKLPGLVEKVVHPVIEDLEEHLYQIVEKELTEELFAEEKLVI
ncbi:9467_t:CDS:2 [Paraglomus occultum]|uniref:9467_t:CDS:1 n=1 Tax=Paraglomus occultum TaxID=144539 RepID=A0A9N8ZKD0_9GLOM|nr:9467_t:CDS:2 [Paraglomus occultum]